MFDGFVEDGGPILEKFLSSAFEIYNTLIGQAVGLLAQSPEAWNASGWALVKTVNGIFAGIGAALVVVFFLMGFCADSLDIRQDFRIENILRMFIKLLLAEFFVASSLKLVKNFFGMATGIISKLSGKKTSFDYKVPAKVSRILNNPGENGIESWQGLLLIIVLMIFAVIFFIIICGCGAMIFYLAFIRFFKIMMLVPYGSLANSTLAGNQVLSQTAVSFWKFALCSILEAVTMYVALILSATILKSGTINLTNNLTGAFYVTAWMMQSMFICLIAVGAIKGASTVTQRALGL